MTKLSSIPEHHLYFECRCGHRGDVSVKSLIARFGEDTSLREVDRHVRCTACGAREIAESRIFYRGSSEVAMQGSARQEDGRSGDWVDTGE